MDDTISRQAAIDAFEGELYSLSLFVKIQNLPSAQPEPSQAARDIATILENEKDMRVIKKNAESESCADTISRKAAIDAIEKNACNTQRIYEAIKALPSAQPEMNLDEWCTDCKEYDHKRHCCPRWNRVIRQTLKDMKEEQPEIIRCKDCIKREICRTSTTWAVAPKDDWYCADAERRTDG